MFVLLMLVVLMLICGCCYCCWCCGVTFAVIAAGIVTLECTQVKICVSGQVKGRSTSLKVAVWCNIAPQNQFCCS